MRPMTFRNYGGVHQLEVVDHEDLARIDSLDPARWAATSAPLRDLHCDPAFLDYLDPAKTGRIRVAQLVSARNWMFERLVHRDGLRAKSDVVRVADLAADKDEGKRLRQAAEHVLAQLGIQQRDAVSLAQVRTFRSGYAQTLANGDGIVPPEAAPQSEVAELIRDIMAIIGSTMDLSNRPGVGGAELDKFIERGSAYLEWKARPGVTESLLPWGPETPETADLVREVDPKIEEYFWYCDLLRQEAMTSDGLRATTEELKALRSHDSAGIEQYLAHSPLATPVATGVLALSGSVNPVYQEKFESMKAKVLARALGADESNLTRAAWRRLKAQFAPYWAWQKEKPAEPFEKLAPAKLEQYLSGPLIDALRHQIEVDQGASAQLGLIADLEKLALFQRWLIELVNNFVNFSAIYDPGQNAMVDTGTLVIDGRLLNFCVKVYNREAHKKVASQSLIFIVYAAISERDQNLASYEVMAPVTSGERGRLRVGKRGIFVDTEGREWDAQIVDVIENPISVPEAIRAPFRRAKNFVAKKFDDLAGSHLSASETAMQAGLSQSVAVPGAAAAAPVAAAPAPKPAAPAGGGMANLQGLLIGGSVAFAAIGSTLAYIFKSVAEIQPLKALGAVASVAGILIAISALLGWMRLRRRDMGLLLEANDWAINANMKLTGRLGRFFTRVPPLPKGSKIEWMDAMLAHMPEERDAQRRRRRRRVLVVILGIALFAAGIALWLQNGGREAMQPTIEVVRKWFSRG